MTTFQIEKKTPASRWNAIHNNLDLDGAKYMLADFAKNYDADADKAFESSLSDDGLNLSAYEGGDLHEFRIVEVA
jgi:hypothetical protein